MHHMREESHGGHQIQNHMMWMLGPEPESSTRAVGALHYKLISPVHDKTLLLLNQDHM